MRENPVRRRLDAGEVVLGTMVTEFATPAIARLTAAAGASSRPQPIHSQSMSARSSRSELDRLGLAQPDDDAAAHQPASTGFVRSPMRSTETVISSPGWR